MELALTRMSANGQVVIPAGMRKLIGAKPSTQFMVLNEGKDIVLKQMDDRRIKEERAFLKSLDRAREDIRKGNYIAIENLRDMSFKEFDDIMMGRKKPGKK